MAAKRGNKLTNPGRGNQERGNQERGNQERGNQNSDGDLQNSSTQGGSTQGGSTQGRSDRPRGFPPSPREASSHGAGPHRSDPRVDSPIDRQAQYGDLSDHPAFSRSGTSPAQMPPPAGYSGVDYIPPGQQTDGHYPSEQPSPSGHWPQQGQPQDPRQPYEPAEDQWQADAKYAPPGLQQPLGSPPTYAGNYQANRLSDGQPGNIAGAQPRQPAFGTDAPTGYGGPSYSGGSHAGAPHAGAPHALATQPHAVPSDVPQPYSPRAHGGAGHGGAVYGDRIARPHAVASEPPRQGSSVGKTILKAIGWTLLLSAILMALVVGGGWYSLRGMATSILNPNTQATIITKAPVVASLKQVNKQIMIEHNNMVDVDYSEAPEGWLAMLPIEQSFVVLLRGRVPAGFDLSGLGEDDVWISNDGSKIQLVLPPPVVFEDNVSVNFDESRIVSEGDTCPNFICAGDLDAIQQTIIPQGRQLLIETSRESGIMEQAAEMGIAYYESLLRSLGFEDIQVLIRSDLEIQQATE